MENQAYDAVSVVPTTQSNDKNCLYRSEEAGKVEGNAEDMESFVKDFVDNILDKAVDIVEAHLQKNGEPDNMVKKKAQLQEML